MQTIVPPKVKIVRKPSLKATLLALPQGIKHRFSTKDFKLQITKNAITELNRKGYHFEITEKGLVNEFDVTRIK